MGDDCDLKGANESAMLNAILRNKAGREVGSDGSLNSIGDMLRHQEDIRTATIFERLSYLPASLMWKVLQRATKTLPRFRISEIASIEFWPSFISSEEGRSRAEPDVFIRWELGDPKVRYDMIVEAKLPTTAQIQEQHEAQLAAYYSEFSADPREGTDAESDLADYVIYLCVDGLGANAQEEAMRLQPKLSDKMPPVRIAACSWQDIANAVGYLQRSDTFDDVSTRLVRDLVDSLGFCGHRYFKIDNSVLDEEGPKQYRKTIKMLSKWNFE